MAGTGLPEFSLIDKVAVVTGGGRGIGKEIALTLARAGAHVAVVARTLPQLEQTVEEMRQMGQRGLALQADITQPEQVTAMVSATIREFERIDILVNNAAIIQTKPIVELPGLKSRLAEMVPEFHKPLTLEDWNIQLQTNLTGVFLVIQAVCPYMIKANKGKIVNITSVEPMRPGSFHTPYSSSKWGVLGLTRSLALELARYNINVNAVAPGYIGSGFSSFYYKDPEIREAMLRQLPLRRLGAPKDVALAVLFLAAAASDFITGHQIPVDGGFSI